MYLFGYFFFIYSFLGWIVEVCFAAFKHGKFVNRGFLNGPLCPIYGSGVLLLLVFLEPFQDNLILLLVGSIILTSFLEYAVGLVLEKLFKQRWWDYSDMKFNIKGYVCPQFSAVWGVACVFVIHIVHPRIQTIVNEIPGTFGYSLLFILSCLLIMDLLATVQTVQRLNKHLEILEELSIRIHDLSNKLAHTVNNGNSFVLESRENSKKIAENIELRFSDQLKQAKVNLNDIKDKLHSRKELSDEKIEQHLRELKRIRKHLVHREFFGERRIFHAFPRLKSHEHKETLEELKKKLKRK